MINGSFDLPYEVHPYHSNIFTAHGWHPWWSDKKWPDQDQNSARPLKTPEYKAITLLDDANRVLDGDAAQCFFVFSALMNAGVRYFILELYDTGTANLRESPFSLRKAFIEGKTRGVNFFCTSQQEGIVDFSGYITSHELWREGAVPMGFLTTESAYTRLLAALLISDDEEEVVRLMEECR